MSGPNADGTSARAADGLLAKLRDFAASLDHEERALLAALLAPGVDAAWSDEPEVAGFGVEWTPARLPEHLATSIRTHDLRIEGWSTDEPDPPRQS